MSVYVGGGVDIERYEGDGRFGGDLGGGGKGAAGEGRGGGVVGEDSEQAVGAA